MEGGDRKRTEREGEPTSEPPVACSAEDGSPKVKRTRTDAREAADAPKSQRTTRVVNVKTSSLRSKRCECCGRTYDSLEAWLRHPNHVYVGRSVRYVPAAFDSDWRNPYFMGPGQTRNEVLKKYRNRLFSRKEGRALVERAPLELRGKTLGCWCHPEPCHAHLLCDLADGLSIDAAADEVRDSCARGNGV